MPLLELLLKPGFYLRRQCGEDHRFQMLDLVVPFMTYMGDIPLQRPAFLKLAVGQTFPLLPVAHKRLPGFSFVLIFRSAVLSGQAISQTPDSFV